MIVFLYCVLLPTNINSALIAATDAYYVLPMFNQADIRNELRFQCTVHLLQ